MTEFKFKLGQTVKDIITGCQGVVMSRSQYLTTCNTYGVQSSILQNGKPLEWQWFDEPRLILQKAKIIKLVPEKTKKGGGPNNINQIAPSR